MKSLLLLISLLASWSLCAEEIVTSLSADEAVTAGVVSAERVPLLLVLDGSSPLLTAVADEITRLYERTGQCVVTRERRPMPSTTEEIRAVGDAGYDFVAYLHAADDGTAITGRLYNTMDVEMLEGKRWNKRPSLVTWARIIASDIWKHLMGNRGSFMASLAYIQRTNVGRRGKSMLYVAGWDGSNPERILTRSTIMVSPSWHHDAATGRDKIYFSEFTKQNVRLMCIDLQGKLSTVLDREGTVVGISLNDRGDTAVYGWSGDIWQFSYDEGAGVGKHLRRIHEEEPAACPLLLANGDILYCQQGAIKHWSLSRGTRERITQGGFATSPCYHEETNTLVYSKRVKGALRLFMTILGSGVHRQITWQGGIDHVDASISPCGNFIAYCLTNGMMSEIHILNLVTGKSERVSPAGAYCMCASWSPS